MSLPPRHAQLIRVDPCHPWLQNAIHQRSHELDVNPQSLVSSSANDQHHRIAASDVSVLNSAPAAIPVHVIVSTTARALVNRNCD